MGPWNRVHFLLNHLSWYFEEFFKSTCDAQKGTSKILTNRFGVFKQIRMITVKEVRVPRGLAGGLTSRRGAASGYAALAATSNCCLASGEGWMSLVRSGAGRGPDSSLYTEYTHQLPSSRLDQLLRSWISTHRINGSQQRLMALTFAQFLLKYVAE